MIPLGKHTMKTAIPPAWTAVALCGILLYSFGCGDPASGPAGAKPDAVPAITVDAEPVASQDMEVFIDAVGSLEAAEDVLISAETAGRVEEVCFEEGMAVPKGTLLIRIDDELIRLEKAMAEARLERLKTTLKMRSAEVRRAKAQAENARTIFERKKTLLDQAASTEAIYLDAKANHESSLAAMDQAEASLDVAHRSISEEEANIRIVEKRVDHASVEAPFDGILGERDVGPGDYVDLGDGLVRLVAVNPLKATFSVPERYRTLLKADLAVSLTVEACPGRTFAGKVNYISPSLDPATRSVKVKASVDNKEGLLRPGFFCKARLILKVNRGARVIAEEAVIPRGEQFFVYTVEGDSAKLREVKPGQRKAGRVEILEGLDAGWTVIIAGHHRVSDGCKVRIRGAAAVPDDQPKVRIVSDPLDGDEPAVPGEGN
jgi:membrane fusion protein (multidrug efflux system)